MGKRSAARVTPALRDERPAGKNARGAAAAPRTILGGRVVQVEADGTVRFDAGRGRAIRCRCPQHVDVGWLRAAVAVGPVNAEISWANDGSPGTVWCLLPGSEHASVATPEIAMTAAKTIKIRCGKTALLFTQDGKVRLRGRDVEARGTQATRIRGATLRFN